jgi:hypothetical protein
MAGFADTDTLIDTLLEKYDQISSSDTDNTARRARYLQFAQNALDEIWISGDYSFTYKTGTVSFTAAGDTADLPADFMEFGEVGGIFNDSTDTQLGEVRPVEAYSGVISSLSGENEDVVAVYGQNTSTGRQTIKFMGNAVVTTTINLLYRYCAPTLADTTGTNSNLWQLPLAFHNPVLLPKILTQISDSHGGLKDYEREYQRGLAFMARRTRSRKTVTQQLPNQMRTW